MATEQNKDVEMKDADDKPLEETTSPEKSNKSKDLLTYEGIPVVSKRDTDRGNSL